MEPMKEILMPLEFENVVKLLQGSLEVLKKIRVFSLAVALICLFSGGCYHLYHTNYLLVMFVYYRRDSMFDKYYGPLAIHL